MKCQYCDKEYTSIYHPNGKYCSRICCVKDWQKKHSAEYQRTRRRKVKAKVFEMLGNKCSKCGYVGSALQLDHVNGGGSIEIRNERIKGNSYTYWKRILTKLLSGSKEYQLLCANHNWEKYYDKQ